MQTKQFRYLLALLVINLKASLALRGAFLLQSLFMLLNNLIFLVTWWIFFHHFEDIGGWGFHEVGALYGIVAGSFGVSMVLGGGVRDIARKISDGDLDSLLTQPKSPLLTLLGSRSYASGWGDIVTCVITLALSGYLTLLNTPLLMLFVFCGASLFLSCALIFYSLAFWLGPVEHLAKQLFEFLVMFSVYPQTIYTGALRLILFTVFPAGFIGYFPIELLIEFSWWRLLALLGVTALYVLIARTCFYVGLRQYESGNRFGAMA